MRTRSDQMSSRRERKRPEGSRRIEPFDSEIPRVATAPLGMTRLLMTSVCLVMSVSLVACSSNKPKESPPTTQPAEKRNQAVVIELVVPAEPGKTKPPRTSKLEPTLTIDATPGAIFSGSTKMGDDTISASGSLFDLAGGKFRIMLRYSHVSPNGNRATQTTLELARGEEFSVAGLRTGDPGEEEVIVLLN